MHRRGVTSELASVIDGGAKTGAWDRNLAPEAWQKGLAEKLPSPMCYSVPERSSQLANSTRIEEPKPISSKARHFDSR